MRCHKVNVNVTFTLQIFLSPSLADANPCSRICCTRRHPSKSKLAPYYYSNWAPSIPPLGQSWSKSDDQESNPGKARPDIEEQRQIPNKNTVVMLEKNTDFAGPDWQGILEGMLKKDEQMSVQEKVDSLRTLNKILSPCKELPWRKALGTRMRIRLKKKAPKTETKTSASLSDKKPNSGLAGPDWQWVIREILLKKKLQRIQEMEKIIAMEFNLMPSEAWTWRRVMRSRMGVRLRRSDENSGSDDGIEEIEKTPKQLDFEFAKKPKSEAG